MADEGIAQTHILPYCALGMATRKHTAEQDSIAGNMSTNAGDSVIKDEDQANKSKTEQANKNTGFLNKTLVQKISGVQNVTDVTSNGNNSQGSLQTQKKVLLSTPPPLIQSYPQRYSRFSAPKPNPRPIPAASNFDDAGGKKKKTRFRPGRALRRLLQRMDTKDEEGGAESATQESATVVYLQQNEIAHKSQGYTDATQQGNYTEAVDRNLRLTIKFLNGYIKELENKLLKTSHTKKNNKDRDSRWNLIDRIEFMKREQENFNRQIRDSPITNTKVEQPETANTMLLEEQRSIFENNSVDIQLEIYNSIIDRYTILDLHISEAVRVIIPFAESDKKQKSLWWSKFELLRGLSFQRLSVIEDELFAVKQKISQGVYPEDPDQIKKLENEIKFLIACGKIENKFNKFRALYEVMSINTPHVVNKVCNVIDNLQPQNINQPKKNARLSSQPSTVVSERTASSESASNANYNMSQRQKLIWLRKTAVSVSNKVKEAEGSERSDEIIRGEEWKMKLLEQEGKLLARKWNEEKRDCGNKAVHVRGDNRKLGDHRREDDRKSWDYRRDDDPRSGDHRREDNRDDNWRSGDRRREDDWRSGDHRREDDRRVRDRRNEDMSKERKDKDSKIGEQDIKVNEGNSVKFSSLALYNPRPMAPPPNFNEDLGRVNLLPPQNTMTQAMVAAQQSLVNYGVASTVASTIRPSSIAMLANPAAMLQQPTVPIMFNQPLVHVRPTADTTMITTSTSSQYGTDAGGSSRNSLLINNTMTQMLNQQTSAVSKDETITQQIEQDQLQAIVGMFGLSPTAANALQKMVTLSKKILPLVGQATDGSKPGSHNDSLDNLSQLLQMCQLMNLVPAGVDVNALIAKTAMKSNSRVQDESNTIKSQVNRLKHEKDQEQKSGDLLRLQTVANYDLNKGISIGSVSKIHDIDHYEEHMEFHRRLQEYNSYDTDPYYCYDEGGQHGGRGGRGGRGGGNDDRGAQRRPNDILNEKLMSVGAPTVELPAINQKEKKFTGKCRLYVGNLNNGVTENEILQLFAPYGETSEIYVSKERNFAFIKMDYRANAEKAKRELDGSIRKGRPLKVSFAPLGAAVKVKNLTPWISNELLAYAFSVFGEVERAVVITDEKGNSQNKGIVEFSRKPSAALALQLCTEGCFYLTNSLHPVILERYEPLDDIDGFPEKTLKKNNPEFFKARQLGPRFAVVGGLEFEYGTRWKQLRAIYKQKEDALIHDMKKEEEKLAAQMEYARYEQEAEVLKEQLRQRQIDHDRQKREWEMKERQADEQRRIEQDKVRRQEEEMQLRIQHKEDELRRWKQENSKFMQVQAKQSQVSGYNTSSLQGGAPMRDYNAMSATGAGGIPLDPKAYMEAYERGGRYAGAKSAATAMDDGRRGNMPSQQSRWGPPDNHGRGAPADDNPSKRRRY